MKNFLTKICQVLLDLIVGVAAYYICTILTFGTSLSIGIALTVCALFAEFYEVKLK